MTLHIAQSAHRRTSRSWAWSVWLEGPSAELDAIQDVTYILHPTFPDPVQRVADRSTGFRLSTHGWGEFRIRVRVRHKDGSHVELSHWLQLADEQGAAQVRGLEASAPQSVQQRIFLSSTATDAPLAEMLSEALKKRGVEAVRPEDVPAGASWSEWVDEQLCRVDALVLLLTSRFDSRLSREVARFRTLDKRILPVVLYGNWSPVTLPQELQSLSPLPLKWDDEQGAESADEIAQTIDDVLQQEER